MTRVKPLLLMLVVTGAAAQGAPPSAEHAAFFEAKIRPVLVEHCYKCHSARTAVAKANLRLDHPRSVLTGGDSGPAVVPGNPDQSLLIQAVRYGNDDLQMPPKGKLSATAVADLVTWVRMGAPWPAGEGVAPRGEPGAKPGAASYDNLRRSHWAYQPVADAPVPAVTDITWPRDSVDHFILERLERAGLRPGRDAERLALVRRVHFDLTGLPPAPEEVDAFLGDRSPEALPALVDRLLASPHFGERWGRHWLDVARYADSTGGGRSQIFDDAWRYRDYVINAFNADKPFNQFAAEQIAGDLLPAGSPVRQCEQLIATGFLAIGSKNLDAQDKDLLRMDVVDEQLDTLGRAFLGLSIGCARCHDHKFDPIPTSEYYALAGILRSTKTLLPGNVSGFVRRPLPGDDPHAARRAGHDERVKTAQAAFDEARNALRRSSLGATIPGPRDASKLQGVVVDDAAARSVGEWKASTFHKTFVGNGYLHDDNHGKGEKLIEFAADLPAAGRYEVRLSYTAGDSRASSVPVTVRHADGELLSRVDQRKMPPIDGLFVSLGTFRFEGGSRSATVVVANEGTRGHVTVDAVQFVPEVAAATPVPKDSVPQAALDELQSRVQRLESELRELKRGAPPAPPMALAVRDEDPKDIADYRICIRGNNHNLGPVVPRGFLSVATVGESPAINPAGSGRRELADWLTRPTNPLTPRVYVNRVWHHLFGTGIVRTPDDFGVAGEPPSHPELLDHLAATFVRDGWSTKRLVRRIVLSRTYQLSTAADASSLAADPENRLRWRMDRRRLDAESLRDAVLMTSVKLDLSVGGPTVQPQASEFEYVFDTTRRSVYIPVFRYSPHELMEAFDFPDPNLVAGRRTASILATQALFLMNSPFMLEQSEVAARRLLEVKGLDDAARVDLAHRRTLGRPPTVVEREIALEHVSAAADDAGRVRAYAGLFQALFASIDFRYLN